MNLACEDCPDLPESVGDEPYFTLDADPAPWYDPKAPETWGFYGVLGLGVTGFAGAPIAREATDLIGDGAYYSPPRLGAREIAYTVALVARDECSLAFGLQYLSWVLNGSSSCQGCAGDQMCLFSCCPGMAPSAYDPGDAEIRHLYDVTLIEAPTIAPDAIQEFGGLLIATTTFTLAAQKPHIYTDPLASLGDWTLITSGQRLNGYDPDEVIKECRQPPNCLDDEQCPPPADPPRPPQIVDPCYPTGPDNWWRTRIHLSPLDQPQYMEAVPVVEIDTGAEELRRVVVRFWLNPQDLPCDQVNDPCQACLDITVPFLPAKSRLTVDGRTQRAQVECPDITTGRASYATPQLYTQLGGPFVWPVFECPTGFCIEVLAPRATVADDARIRVQLVPRSQVG
ncbi:hypothetical protein DY218_27290 [Streptomyces triticagri]|uniref:Uncharacterized protein n=1 Tax=Streptomyces triticagri TaxID=2293568 RepID=A0A372LY63_9ACTN|nr:hypothetical protein DY218_27290 [Streptomyces triticagri]